MTIAGVILAGGRSKRMGQNKSLLMINNKTLLQYVSGILFETDIKDIYISGQDGIHDKHPDKGPIGGILSCLLSLKKHEYVLFTPVDMPLITKNVIQELMQSRTFDLVHYEKYNLPLIIANNENVRKILEKQIKNNDLSIYALIENLETKILKNNHELELFMNTNSPEQWEIAKVAIHKLLKQQP